MFFAKIVILCYCKQFLWVQYSSDFSQLLGMDGDIHNRE